MNSGFPAGEIVDGVMVQKRRLARASCPSQSCDPEKPDGLDQVVDCFLVNTAMITSRAIRPTKPPLPS